LEWIGEQEKHQEGLLADYGREKDKNQRRIN
jgi:hypothetical protein